MVPRVRAFFILGVVLMSGVTARSSAADEASESVELSWDVPLGCPDRASVQGSLARLLTSSETNSNRTLPNGSTQPVHASSLTPHARDGVETATPQQRTFALSTRATSNAAGSGGLSRHLLRVAASVVRSGEEDWTLTLRTDLDGISGERVLRGRSCAALTDAAVLTMALMLNPDIDVDRAAPTNKETEPPATTDLPSGTVSLVAPRSVRTIERDRASLGLQLSTQMGLAAGILPKLGPEIGVGVGVTLGRFALALNGDWGPVQNATLSSAANMGGKLWSGSLALMGCWSFQWQQLSAGPCIGASVTRIEGNGFGIAHPQTAIIHFASPLTAARVDWQLDRRFALRLLMMGLAPIDRPSIYIDDLGDVHHPTSINGRVQLGAVFHLR